MKEVIVVEGKKDSIAVQRAVGADTIETGGSAINDETLKRIKLAHTRRGIIILTDPDSPGERIRKIVAAHVPGCKHAFLMKKEALGKHGLGIEHASDEAIRQALAKVRQPDDHNASQDTCEIQWEDLFHAGLIVVPGSAQRRARMGELLGIGYSNGKQFYKRCIIFRITHSEFQAALKKIGQERI